MTVNHEGVDSECFAKDEDFADFEKLVEKAKAEKPADSMLEKLGKVASQLFGEDD